MDLNSREPRGSGFPQLSSVWTDHAFDPDSNAWYYARAVENPTCRWQQRMCSAHGISCENIDELSPEFAGCCDDAAPRTLQERARSSPIWHRGASL